MYMPDSQQHSVQTLYSTVYGGEIWFIAKCSLMEPTSDDEVETKLSSETQGESKNEDQDSSDGVDEYRFNRYGYDRDGFDADRYDQQG